MFPSNYINDNKNNNIIDNDSNHLTLKFMLTILKIISKLKVIKNLETKKDDVSSLAKRH